MKHAAKMTEWRERIHDCRSSGKPVRTWCEENKINEKTYYRWERLYMAGTGTGAGMTEVERTQGVLVRIEPEHLREEGAMAIADTGVITVRHGSTSVELPVGVPMSQIAALIKALC